MNRHKIGSNKCPNCEFSVKAVFNYEEGKDPPQPGNIVVCLKCDKLMEFREDMTLRLFSNEEFDLLPILDQFNLNIGIETNKEIRNDLIKKGIWEE